VVLVGAHDAVDLVAVPFRHVRSNRRPEAGNLDQQLGAGEAQERRVPGDQEVLPDVVGDGDVDVALQVRVVGQPAPGLRVEVQPLGFLPPVRPALPGKHCTVETFGSRRCPGRPEAGVPVLEQGAGQRRTLEVEERKDEQLVPEDVASVGLAILTSGWYADVQVRGVRGDSLQQVEDV
jgi:hypothetical protein